jgi:hypothetical protein
MHPDEKPGQYRFALSAISESWIARLDETDSGDAVTHLKTMENQPRCCASARRTDRIGVLAFARSERYQGAAGGHV